MVAIADSGIVTKSNLITQSYANLYNLINTRTNVANPIDPSGTRKLVYEREPNEKNYEFKGYPIIILRRPTLDPSEPSLDGKQKNISWEFEIEIRCSNKIRNWEGYGAKWVDEITDDILETINDDTNKRALRAYGMEEPMPSVDDQDEIDLGKDTLFVARITIPFSRVLGVSS